MTEYSQMYTQYSGQGVPEQALGGIPLGFEIVVEDKPFELSCPVEKKG